MSRQDSRARYESVVRTVEHNTGGPDTNLPAGVRWSTVGQNRFHAGESWDDVHSALLAACSNGDLVRYRDRAGTVRYCRRTVDALRDVIEAESTREHPSRELIAQCNRIIQELRDADD